MLIIKLHDLRTDFVTEVEVNENMSLSRFADLVRREMTLPYDSNVRYRKTSCQGHVYMQADAIAEYVDMLWEGADDPNDLEKRNPIYYEDYYTPESGVRVDDLFTVIGSGCHYRQGSQHVRCTLIERE